MKNIVIIDDLSEHMTQMETIIMQMNEDFIIKKYNNPQLLHENITSFPIDTIFIIDILIGEVNGIEFAKEILEKLADAHIIFISSYLEKATEVYEVDHCYFVYKPEMTKRLPLAIHKALNNIQLSHQILSIQLKDKIKIIQTKDIYYLERHKRTTYIYCQDEVIQTALKLKDLLPSLPFPFIRCHNSYIVNLDMVSECKRTYIILHNNDINPIPISRAYHQSVKETFHKYLLKKI